MNSAAAMEGCDVALRHRDSRSAFVRQDESAVDRRSHIVRMTLDGIGVSRAATPVWHGTSASPAAATSPATMAADEDPRPRRVGNRVAAAKPQAWCPYTKISQTHQDRADDQMTFIPR